ncbi:hypothetical protein N9L02_00660 [Gammaproteobacteria bacterium]|nr:hypothetical protein [Gammaproteobacteria bacterium]
MFHNKANWRTYFEQSKEAKALETKLIKPPYNMRLIEHNDEKLASTANTDVENGIINLDTTQKTVKIALSYAYELKNFENRTELFDLIQAAKTKSITKSQYVNGTLLIEAKSAYFRCLIFREFKLKDSEFPNKKDYLRLYDLTKDSTSTEAIEQFKTYMLENGIVRKKFSAKKYYADAYDAYTNKKSWPKEYDQKDMNETILLKWNGENKVSK